MGSIEPEIAISIDPSQVPTINEAFTIKGTQNRILEELKQNREQVTSKTLSKLRTYLRTRWRLSLSLKEIFKLKFLGCKCRSRPLNKSLLTKQKIFHKGQNKIKNELDCINNLTKLRQLDLILSLFLTVPQKVLLYYQKKQLIQEEDISSDEDLQTKQYVQKYVHQHKNQT